MLKCDKVVVDKYNQNYKILIIEDTEFINNSVKTTLEEIGHSCEQSFDYENASYLLENNKYSFIVLDLNLPDAYGEELVANVSRLSQKAKIIILTAETDIQTRENLFRYGILDYIVKDKHFSNSIKAINDTIQNITNNISTTVLAIDDSKFMCKQIEKVLSVKNYNILSKYNAKDGLETLNHHFINLIVLDMELPDGHGLDILREIKSKPQFRTIPVIIISGSNDPETVRESLKLGAFDFIKKPFNIEEFTLKVDMAIEINRKDRDILCKQQVLNEYKDAVDRSSIVSKTNTEGKITFVNDKFCELSGYSEKELLGKPHNVVRHPDMPSLIFKEIWKTIQDKRSWTGKIKNKKKNGDEYYVNTVISPIVDFDGKIIEYIGIRTDITELEVIKKELEENLNISNKNFTEAYKISQEYKHAIEESNILSRMDIDGKITYANQAFFDITGYTKDEVIGKSHIEIIKHPQTPSKVYANIWETISNGNVWTGQLKNISKSKKSFYVDTTIVPIKGIDDEIIEYVIIRHDITDTIIVHKEMENTQKEIIHKMGEVGESRSKETGFHVKRVAEYSKLLALLAGLGNKRADLLYWASPMHDIGKVGIPDSILKKPGRLDADEWVIMKGHSLIGYNILKDSKRPILKAAALVSYRHHEKWDGSGYPNGIAGEKIHIFGRITAVADVFDALGSDRVYKKAWELDRIVDLFKEEKGKHFDPSLVDIFLDNLDKFLKIRDKYVD